MCIYFKKLHVLKEVILICLASAHHQISGFNVASVKMTIFWDIAPCSLVDIECMTIFWDISPGSLVDIECYFRGDR
jgi:hypothetical protein